MWSPLREPVFRALWIAALASNMGSFMQDVASAWLMTSMTTSPLMVALLQTAGTLPFFAFALPAGALADLLDRKWLLIFGQAWMLVAALALGVMTWLGMTTPWSLLLFTFMLGLGAAISSPTWNALIPDMVPRKELEPAIALGSVGYNMARGLGSAISGLAVAAAGPAAVFLLNAVSFITVMWVLIEWKRERSEDAHAKGERVLGAMRAGMRFARHSPFLVAIFFKSCSFATCAGALWGLLPLVARNTLKLSSIQSVCS